MRSALPSSRLLIPFRMFVACASVSLCCAADETRPTAVHLVGHEDTALLQRVQDLIDDWDPRKLVNPYAKSVSMQGDTRGSMVTRKVLRREDLAEFIADVDAAEALGKAFFWEMQAGSDFRKLPGTETHIGTACATCHFKYGADARDRFTTRIPYVVWDEYDRDTTHPLVFNETPKVFDVVSEATKVLVPDEEQPLSMIVGSQGVEPRVFKGIKSAGEAMPFANGYWEEWEPRNPDGFVNYKPDWSMFIENQSSQGKYFRQITSRNSPTVINSGFADRLFHDGRAESTFNGFSIFGDHDQREILYRRTKEGKLELVRVAIPDAALASQAVGPIVNEVEMSYLGRTFHHLACKLLDAKVLGHQAISDNDSVLWEIAKAKKECGKEVVYRDLIRRAFRQEWWNDAGCKPVDLMLAELCDESPERPKGSLMHANFSLYWGLSVMMYEASLVSNESPFDAMMAGNGEPVNKLWDKIKADGFDPIPMDRVRTNLPAPNGIAPPNLVYGNEVFQQGFRLFMNRGCIECHSGPLFSELYERDRFEDNTLPIAHQMHNVLLRNAQADAIAIVMAPIHQQMLKAVAQLLRMQPKLAAHADRIALNLDLLREQVGGSEATLADMILTTIQTGDIDSTTARQIASLMMTYEKTVYDHVGNRPFFREPDRVAAADLLVEPVLVEQMRIPANQRDKRRPLPFTGVFPDRDHVFYDMAFYAIGVAPPRYDRGIGFSSVDAGAISGAMVAKAVVQHRAAQDALPENQKLAGVPETARSLSPGEIAEAIVKPGGLVELGYSEEVAKKFVDDVESRLQSGQSARQAASGVSGSAYQFKQKYRSRKSSLLDDKLEANPAPVNPSPKPCDATLCDPDKDARTQLFADTSWDRDDLSPDTRRADRHFFSRARSLVLNEHPWGYRKPLIDDNELAFWGAFKTPTLRNVSVTGPYMHNGRLMSLFEVVKFYSEGGDVPLDREHNPDKHPEIVPFKITNEQTWALVFFLHCLTDPRVTSESGEFDHPELRVVNGYETDLSENIVLVPSKP